MFYNFKVTLEDKYNKFFASPDCFKKVPARKNVQKPSNCRCRLICHSASKES
jgi:hypothetical protein